jgi:arylsulfatase A-like enzyme
MSTFAIWGPGIKAGYSRDPEKRGFVRLLDVVPTIAHLLGFQPPRTCEGTVLWDHFVD